MEVKQYRQSAANAGARVSQNLEIRAEHPTLKLTPKRLLQCDSDEAPGQLKPSGESLNPHLTTLQVLTPSYPAGFHSSQTV